MQYVAFTPASCLKTDARSLQNDAVLCVHCLQVTSAILPAQLLYPDLPKKHVGREVSVTQPDGEQVFKESHESEFGVIVAFVCDARQRRMAAVPAKLIPYILNRITLYEVGRWMEEPPDIGLQKESTPNQLLFVVLCIFEFSRGHSDSFSTNLTVTAYLRRLQGSNQDATHDGRGCHPREDTTSYQHCTPLWRRCSDLVEQCNCAVCAVTSAVHITTISDTCFPAPLVAVAAAAGRASHFGAAHPEPAGRPAAWRFSRQQAALRVQGLGEWRARWRWTW